jgi:protein-tyrosine kinase
MSVIERALQKSRAEGASAPPGTFGEWAAPGAARAPRPVPANTPQVPTRHVGVDRGVAEQSAALLDGEDEAAARAYKILRTQLLRRLNKGCGLVAVTAVNAGDGKTVTSLNLALSLARDVNTRVCLVDMDLQRPSIARYLGMQAGTGLDDYLAGRAPMEALWHDIGVPRLTVVPALGALTDASDALRSPAMMDLFDALHRQRCVAILDMPPLLMGDDVLVVAPHLDGVLLVVGEGNTPRSALAAARNVLAEMNVLGVVLNRSSERGHAKYY